MSEIETKSLSSVIDRDYLHRREVEINARWSDPYRRVDLPRDVQTLSGHGLRDRHRLCRGCRTGYTGGKEPHHG